MIFSGTQIGYILDVTGMLRSTKDFGESVISYPFLSVSAPAAVVFLESSDINYCRLVKSPLFKHAPFSSPVTLSILCTLSYFALVQVDDISTSPFDHCPVAWPLVQYNGCYLASANNLRLPKGNRLLSTHQYGTGDITESSEQCAALYRTARFVVMVPRTCFCLSLRDL